MKSDQQLFAERKRRSVLGVSAVCGGVASGLHQVADPLADASFDPQRRAPPFQAPRVRGGLAGLERS